MSRTESALWPSLLPPDRFGADDTCFVSASGVRLTTASGRELLCGTSGLWNVNLGYGNAAVTRAVAEVAGDASYLGVFRYENSYARSAADALVDLAGSQQFSKVLFSTSGGAANDLVMKLARHYQALAGRPGRRLVVGLRNGFHGLTFGSSALTHEDLGQRTYGVDRSLVRHVGANDVGQLARLFERHGDKIAAIVLEPLQGTGAVPLTTEYVDEVARLAEAHDVLVVADEVATGFHRLGEAPFASAGWSRPPDLMVSSKGLTNGTAAAAAVLVSRRVTEPFMTEQVVVGHAETQAGTAVSCAAILATIEECRRLDAGALAAGLAGSLDVRIEELVEELPTVTGSDGAGCFRSLQVTVGDGPISGAEVTELVAHVRAAGAVVHPGPDGIQLVPALTYTDSELDELFDAVRRGLSSFGSASRRQVA